MSSGDFSDCRGTVTSSLPSSCFLFYSLQCAHLVFSLFLSCSSSSYPPPTCLLFFCPIQSFTVSVVLFPPFWSQDIGRKQMGHMPEWKGLRWEGEMLRQSVSLLFVLPWMMFLWVCCFVALPSRLGQVALRRRVNGVNLHPALCRSVQACSQLLLSAYIRLPWGVRTSTHVFYTHTHTHWRKGKKKNIHQPAL